MRKMLAFLALFAATPALAQTVPSLPRAATAVASSFLLQAGNVYVPSINVTTGATAGYAMLFDTVTPPVNGAVAPLWCVPVAVTTGIAPTFPYPMRFKNGAMLVFSSTGCFTLTLSATAFLGGAIQ